MSFEAIEVIAKDNQVIFRVAADASKPEIKAAVEFMRDVAIVQGREDAAAAALIAAVGTGVIVTQPWADDTSQNQVNRGRQYCNVGIPNQSAGFCVTSYAAANPSYAALITDYDQGWARDWRPKAGGESW